MKTKSNEKYIAIYSRKSKFSEKGESIGNQIDLCKEYIEAHFENASQRIVVFEDEGYSGGNLNRPGFKKMMDEVEKRKIEAIVVYRLDRISRNVGDFSKLIDELNRKEIAFVSIREQFDTTSPMGRAMMYIASVFSQLERETIAERIRDNMHELAKTGRWLGGTTPTGYVSVGEQSITIDGKKRKSFKLEIFPEEAEVIRLIFQYFYEHKSLTKTETELLRLGIKTKNGRDYTRFALKSILHNPVYVIADEKIYQYFKERDADISSNLTEFNGQSGIMAYNRTKQEKGKASVNLPINEWIVAVGKHPGIIDSKVWIGVQDLLDENKEKSYYRARINEALLTGLIFCDCGAPMYPKLSNRFNNDGSRSFSYVCTMKTRSKKSRCEQKNINGVMLDHAIVEQIKKLSEDKDEFMQLLGVEKESFHNNRGQYEMQLEELKTRKTSQQRKITALIDSLIEAEDSVTRNHINQRIKEYDYEMKQTEEQIKELEDVLNRDVMNEDGIFVLAQLLKSLSTTIDSLSIEEKRAAIRTVVRKIIWDGENVHVILFGDPDGDTRKPIIGFDDINALEDFDVDLGSDFTLSCEDSKRNIDVYPFSKTQKM